jgi:two-component system, OmpR family, sensor histidine kinase QseC
MIHSIRQFLLISLLISITIASSITAIGNYLLDKQVIQPYLDDQLIEFFTLIETFVQTAKTPAEQYKIFNRLYNQTSTPTETQFFQVYNEKGTLVLHSKKYPTQSLRHIRIGLSDQQIDGNTWRVYASYDRNNHYKIITAELYEMRKKLADDIARNNAYILLVTYPLFGVLIWVIVSLALRSVVRVTSEISSRASTRLEPVDASNIPIEIKPLVTELNQLFIRLRLAFDRNKRFAADAAHELRTPLAALKTQAQVAKKAENEQERNNALQKMIQGVDRSSHIVTQLLTLSKLTQEEGLNDIKPIDLHKIAVEIIAYLAPQALEKNIEIELAPPPVDVIIMGNDTALSILIRNIVDNAIRYTPLKGSVKIQLLNHENQVIFSVSDTGSGIPVELRERVFERFFRMLGTTSTGSGLGLAIVHQIAELHKAKITLTTPSNGIGLQFNVAFQNLVSLP